MRSELASEAIWMHLKLVDRKKIKKPSRFLKLAISASEWPLRPNMTSSMAMSWPILPIYQISGHQAIPNGFRNSF